MANGLQALSRSTVRQRVSSAELCARFVAGIAGEELEADVSDVCVGEGGVCFESSSDTRVNTQAARGKHISKANKEGGGGTLVRQHGTSAHVCIGSCSGSVSHSVMETFTARGVF